MEARRTTIRLICWLRPSTKWSPTEVTTMAMFCPRTFSVTPFFVSMLAWSKLKIQSPDGFCWPEASIVPKPAAIVKGINLRVMFVCLYPLVRQIVAESIN